MSPDTAEELRKLAEIVLRQNQKIDRLSLEASAQIEQLKAKVAALKGKMK